MPVLDLTQRRLERALRLRARYRYVRPQVLRDGRGFRIQSPCCSRKIDPTGGVIDIALLLPQGGHRWSLYGRDHQAQTWALRLEHEPLDVLLEVLCKDSEHQFWP
jgi:hypothetical protein